MDNSNFSESMSCNMKTSSSSSKLTKKVAKEAYTALFGEEYSRKECNFVLVAGALIAFNSGFVNGACFSGFLFPSGEKQVVAGYVASYTISALALVDKNYSLMGFHFGMIRSYAVGAFIAGLFSPDVTPYQIQPSYGPTFLVGGVFLLGASCLAAFDSSPSYVFFLATAANGIQNGIATLYSANLIRCTLTGTTTDATLVLAQVLRGNRKNMYRGMVQSLILLLFWIGGAISFFATRHFLSYTLFFNATLFWLIGLALVYFLVSEIGINVHSALYGSWEWKKALQNITDSIHQRTMDSLDEYDDVELNLLEVFDEIDSNGNDLIEPAELLATLQDAGVKISAKGIKILFKASDRNGDGMLDREEWAKLCSKIKLPRR